MTNSILARLLVLLCCLSLTACTSTKLIYPAKSGSPESSWAQKIKTGDKLEVLLKGEKKPITLKVTEITLTDIKGEKNVSVPIENIASVKIKHFSWVKTTFLTLGTILMTMVVSIQWLIY